MSKTIYDQLVFQNNQRIAKAERDNTVVSISQSDFTNGTYQITQSGVYRLSENITFNPNNLALAQSTGLPGQAANPSATGYDTGMPTSAQFTYNGGDYDVKAFGIGFFAAISIQTSDVTLDLNGFTLEQSDEHSLQQKFYANIELADQPFIPTQGPHDFGSIIKSAKKVCVMNGTLGNSAHHQIHGNDNTEVLLKDLIFQHHEVTTVALNNAQKVAIVKCFSNGSRRVVPILAIWSAARFLRNYVDVLETTFNNNNADVLSLTVNGVTKSPSTIKNDLKTAMNNVFADVITNKSTTGGFIDKNTHPNEWSLFNNSAKHIDGNTYGMLLNSRGVAVFGFPDKRDTKSSDIYIEDVTLNDIVNTIVEIPVLASPGVSAYTTPGVDDPPGAQTDAVGAVFQTQNKNGDGVYVTVNNMNAGAGNAKYIGNVVANAQLLITKNVLNKQTAKDALTAANLSTIKLSITQSVVDWAENSTNLNDVINGDVDLYWICNGDGMFHVNKGAIGLKLDCVDRALIKNFIVNGIASHGNIGSTLAGDYRNSKSHPLATLNGFGGCNVRGISMASSANIKLVDCLIRNASSNYGYVYGYDIFRQSTDIKLENCKSESLTSGTTASISDYENNPTPVPKSVGIHIDNIAKNVTLKNVYMSGTNSSLDAGFVSCVENDSNTNELSVGSKS
jgi:hypothetical protein